MSGGGQALKSCAGRWSRPRKPLSHAYRSARYTDSLAGLPNTAECGYRSRPTTDAGSRRHSAWPPNSFPTRRAETAIASVMTGSTCRTRLRPHASCYKDYVLARAMTVSRKSRNGRRMYITGNSGNAYSPTGARNRPARACYICRGWGRSVMPTANKTCVINRRCQC